MTDQWIDADGVIRLRGTFTGGGSQTFDRIVVPLAFNTAGILTGVAVTDLAEGDSVVLDASYISIWPSWDGTTPRMRVFTTDASDVTLGSGGCDAPDVGAPDDSLWAPALNPASYWNRESFHVASATAVEVLVDDGSDGSPGSMQGAATLVLVVGRAA